MAVNEIIDLERKSRKECLIFNMDFKKVYDSVMWSFINYMMIMFRLGDMWHIWTKACVLCGILSMLINGFPTKEINI